MATGASNNKHQIWWHRVLHSERMPRHLLALVALFALLTGANRAMANEATLSEYQIKSIFLLNFAKYVEWPVDAFSKTNTPITIGILGENKLGKDLEKTVQNKQVGGRKINILHLTLEDQWKGCHILFISASEKKRMPEVLRKLRVLPVLTVGETEQFTEQGGIIRFLKKEEKVRLEIDLKVARQARLQISSKLLSVADVVKQ